LGLAAGYWKYPRFFY